MASTEGLVPITRKFLASYYDKYPFSPLSDDVSRLSSEIRSIILDLLKESPPSSDESALVQQAECQPPHKVDENMWKNREQMEEILFLLEKPHWPHALQQPSTSDDNELASTFLSIQDKFQKTLKTLESFQSKNSERVFNIVMTYMPQDFRGTIIRLQRERSEKNKQAEVDALETTIGSAWFSNRCIQNFGEVFGRSSRVSVFVVVVNSTCFYSLHFAEFVLLDFIRQINDDEGHKDHIRVLEQAVDVYSNEFIRFITFISEVFANSPFFIPADSAGAIEGRNSDDYKEISIPAGKTHEVLLSVESINSYIAWDFSLTQGKMSMDIGFSVEYIDASSQKTLILPYRRCESDQVKRTSSRQIRYHQSSVGHALFTRQVKVNHLGSFCSKDQLDTLCKLQQPSTSDDNELASTFLSIQDKFQKTLKTLEYFQSKNSERVFNIVMTYMPQDFRGTIIRLQRERSEKNKQAEVDALVSSGGSIHDKYTLLWQQQMDRRRQLAQLGSATGVYKTLVKYLVGVPEVLLDFIRQINDDEGPMEEQRHRYGPPLYSLTTMILFVRVFVLLLWSRYDAGKIHKDHVRVLEQAVNVYSNEFIRFITFISEVFAYSPFFISAGAIEGRNSDDYKEISIPAGRTHEVQVHDTLPSDSLQNVAPETARHVRLFLSQIVDKRFDNESLRILESIMACKDMQTIMETRSSLREFMRSESLTAIRELSQHTVEQKLLTLEFFVRSFTLIGDIESILSLKYEGLLLRELKSTTHKWKRVSYMEWLKFAHHSFDNGYHAVAIQACDKALLWLNNDDTADPGTCEPFKCAEEVEKVKRLKDCALRFVASNSVQGHVAEYLRKRIPERRSQMHMSTSTQPRNVASILFRNGIRKRNSRDLHEYQRTDLLVMMGAITRAIFSHGALSSSLKCD
ncbi:Protein DOUBLE-STRAND BREAK FORMATION [Linum perenne]